MELYQLQSLWFWNACDDRFCLFSVCLSILNKHIKYFVFTEELNWGFRSRAKRDEEYMGINIYVVFLLLFYTVELLFIKTKTAVIALSEVSIVILPFVD